MSNNEQDSTNEYLFKSEIELEVELLRRNIPKEIRTTHIIGISAYIAHTIYETIVSYTKGIINTEEQKGILMGCSVECVKKLNECYKYDSYYMLEDDDITKMNYERAVKYMKRKYGKGCLNGISVKEEMQN